MALERGGGEGGGGGCKARTAGCLVKKVQRLPTCVLSPDGLNVRASQKRWGLRKDEKESRRCKIQLKTPNWWSQLKERTDEGAQNQLQWIS